MNDLAEGDTLRRAERGAMGASAPISCSCFIPNLRRILLSTLISLCWGVGGESLIASLMRGCGVVMREAHFIFYWGDEISQLHGLRSTLCVKSAQQDSVLTVTARRTSSRTGYSVGCADLEFYIYL
jgi:hypothetical protein